ncbi:E3 ubiquitin-protein ligase ORTHRUS 2-like [Andrographis paniculata]|uniref:E3 ubiquitin-protein ligase ORTHRUS 2-like n=1 Tax=Andrographis paniculata TaxID=175694 RepID=UPI0021E7FB5C|nr:E3 ubiquitin-protein ligase ORTHRUS 2-like [Andrographis paniculata]
MANGGDLPCDGDGVCMVCNCKAAEGETVTCKTCVTPWHASCLSTPLETLGDARNWNCPDCSDLATVADVKSAVSGGGLVEKIRAIEADSSLTDQEKAVRRQELLGGGGIEDEEGKSGGDVLGILGDQFKCSICMQLLDRPVSTPCGHNFCLKCFQKWVGIQGKKTCAMCRKSIPPKMAMEPRINSAIVMAIRMAKLSHSNHSGGAPKVYHVIHNQDRPDKAFTTTRAKKSGKANACSGKIFVTVPLDHFGPITAENDPTRNRGVCVGDTWEDRMECRQWGAHFPHVAGICGQADCGAQSVALSGGYVDDEDHGDWFLYTGSGGRDLSGNKRTNKSQSFDQTFEKFNEALRRSCRKGYPVRVVRSHKEKRSSYAPQEGVRYDGIYRIEKCWRKAGSEGHKLCRYLFVRCDNDPAPWTSDTLGDMPRSSLPKVAELKHATDITERKGDPSWGYDEEKGCWTWKKPPPESRKSVGDGEASETGTKRRSKAGYKKSVKERLLREFSCLICRNVMVSPLTTPCAHNFCKGCLEGAFAGQSFVKERTCGGTRTLRTQKNIMRCPTCKNDISDYLQNPQVNRELMGVIESLQKQMAEENTIEEEATENGNGEGDGLSEEADEKSNCDDADADAEIDTAKGDDDADENVEEADENKESLKAAEGKENEKTNLKQSSPEAKTPRRRRVACGEDESSPRRCSKRLKAGSQG